MIKLIEVECIEELHINSFVFFIGEKYWMTRAVGNYGTEPVMKIYSKFKGHWYPFVGDHVPGNFKTSFRGYKDNFAETGYFRLLRNKKSLNTFVTASSKC